MPTSAPSTSSTPARRGRGRPAKGDQAKTRVLSIRFTDAEYRAVAERAREAGLKVAPYVRSVALRKKMPSIVPQLNVDAWADLARFGSNLNQLAHHANEGQRVHLDEVLLMTLYGAVESLRRELLGMSEPEDGD